MNPQALANLDELGHYEAELQRFLGQEIDHDRFTAARLQQGVYGQRQDGVHMVRVKLPGGRVAPRQLEAIADTLEEYAGSEHAHITTRQDIQLHHVPLADTASALYRLAEAGLTTREACGNTIRNVTACPLAGACPREHTDVTQHLEGAVVHFLRNPLNQQMPRKFKISFSGCESDCAQGMIHDLGIVAVREQTGAGERFGFRLLAGGGLGHKPHEAIVVAPLVEERELIAAIEAVVSLHNRYSDRVKRAKSRIKFLVDRFGPEGFVERFHEEFARTRKALASSPAPSAAWKAGTESEAPGPGAPRRAMPQKQPGRWVVPIAVPLGMLTAAQLRGLARALRELSLTELRTTQDQNLMVLDVPSESLLKLRARIAAIGLAEPAAGDNVVACPGTSSCRLGITASTVVAPKLSGGEDDLRIRVSGCHNGCAQPETGDIGIYGEGRRLFGKLIPHYQTYFGGDGTRLAGEGGLALKGPSVPAMRIEKAIARVRQAYADERQADESFAAWTRRAGIGRINELLDDLVKVEERFATALARDHGDSADFRVLQLGGGECAGATQVMVGRWFFDAAHERGYRDAFVFQRQYAEAAGCAEAQLRLVGQGLVEFLNERVDGGLADFAARLAARPDARALGLRLAGLAYELNQAATIGEEAPLKRAFADIDGWIGEAAAFAQAREPQLDLRDALPRSEVAAARPVRLVARQVSHA